MPGVASSMRRAHPQQHPDAGGRATKERGASAPLQGRKCRRGCLLIASARSWGVRKQDCQCEPVVGHVRAGRRPLMDGRPSRAGRCWPINVSRPPSVEAGVEPAVDPMTTIRP